MDAMCGVERFAFGAGTTVVLEPGDATRYYVTFFWDSLLTDEGTIGVALAQGTGHRAGVFAHHSLERGWDEIKDMDVNERVTAGTVQWLADKMKVNPYTAAAIYQAYAAMRIEAEAYDA